MLNFWLFHFVNSFIVFSYYVYSVDRSPTYIQNYYDIIFYWVILVIPFLFFQFSKNKYIKYSYLTYGWINIIFITIDYLVYNQGYYILFIMQEIQSIVVIIATLNYKAFLDYSYKLNNSALYKEDLTFIVYKKYPLGYMNFLIAYFGIIYPGFYSVGFIHQGYFYGFKKGIYSKLKLDKNSLKRYNFQVYNLNTTQLDFLNSKLGSSWKFYDSCHIIFNKCLRLGDRNG